VQFAIAQARVELATRFFETDSDAFYVQIWLFILSGFLAHSDFYGELWLLGSRYLVFS
jgi:hypothetical protein